MLTRKIERRDNSLTRKTDIFPNEKRQTDRRKSTILHKKVIEKIEVRSPYYALYNLEEIENGLQTDIIVEQPLNIETSPITAGETSRHLAILGSCAIALKRDTAKCFYLATKAEYKRHNYDLHDDLVGIAKVGEITKRKAIAHTKLMTKKDELITTLDVEYTILSKEIFERQFKEHRIDLRGKTTRINRENFYKQFEIQNKCILKDGKTMECSLYEITPDMCMGHFPNYPALPVAFAANLVFNLTINFLETKILKHNFKKICVQYTNMIASQLIFAGTNIKINIEFINFQEKIYHFKTNILDNNSNIVYMDLKYGIYIRLLA